MLIRTLLSIAAALAAQVAARAAPAGGNAAQVLFLGTAGGPPIRAGQSEPATLLIVNGRHYLFDCGIGTARRLAEAGLHSRSIDAIFLTHLHADHSLGLAAVMADAFFVREAPDRAPSVPVYGPPQTKELVNSAFRNISVGFRPFQQESKSRFPSVDGQFVNPFEPREFDRDGLVFEDSNIRVTAAENSHFALLSPAERAAYKSYSYRVVTKDGSIFLTGDTGPSKVVTALAHNADLLIAEATYRDPADLDQLGRFLASRNGWPPARTKVFRDHFQAEHLDARQVGLLASEAGARTVVLYHYNPVDEGDRQAFIRGVRKSFRGPVFAARDLERYCLRGGATARC